MVSITKHLLEHQARLFNSAGPRQCLNQPETADAEGAFAPADAVHRVILAERVAMHQAIHGQTTLDPLQGPNHARVAGRNEKNQRHQEQARIHPIGAVILNERVATLAPSLFHDFAVDLVPMLKPRLLIGGKTSLAAQPQPAVERHPAHWTSINEMTW